MSTETPLLRDLRELHELIASEAARIGSYSDHESAAEARTMDGCARRLDEVLRRHTTRIPVGRVDLGGGTVYRVEGKPDMTPEAWTAWIDSTGKTPLETPGYELRAAETAQSGR